MKYKVALALKKTAGLPRSCPPPPPSPHQALGGGVHPLTGRLLPTWPRPGNTSLGVGPRAGPLLRQHHGPKAPRETAQATGAEPAGQSGGGVETQFYIQPSGWALPRRGHLSKGPKML